MSTPTSDLVIYAGVFVKTWRILLADTLIEQHTHTWDHVSLLCQGQVRVFANGASIGVYVAPALIKIAANAPHHFISLTDDTVIACIHAVGSADPTED